MERLLEGWLRHSMDIQPEDDALNLDAGGSPDTIMKRERKSVYFQLRNNKNGIIMLSQGQFFLSQDQAWSAINCLKDMFIKGCSPQQLREAKARLLDGLRSLQH